jgi:broad specificity phosphatase PhoE
MRRAHWSLGAAVCFVTAVACGRSQAAAAPAPAADSTNMARPVESVVLEVENHNWSDIVVYVSHDGVVTRLALVTASSNTSVPLPAHLVGSLGVVRLAVRRIGGTDSYASEPISIRTGSTLRLTVESRVATSSVAVW